MRIERTSSSIKKTRPALPLEYGVLGLTLLAVLAILAFVLTLRLPGAAAAPAPLAPQVATPVTTATPPPATSTPTSADAGDLLDTLYIDIAPDAMAKISAKRDEALKLGVLLSTSDDYVEAHLRLNDEDISAKMRLKGDWIEHIMFDKWSFRIVTRGEQYIYGMKTLAIQDPARRSYLNEWLFLKNLDREGVLGVRYNFIRVVLNGKFMGIYAVEEGMAKELIESRQRRAGLLLRYNEDLMWKYRAYDADPNIPIGVNDFYLIDDYGAGDTPLSAPGMAAASDVAVGELRAVWTGERPAGEVFDVELMGRFLALSDLWSAPHGLIWHNLRYYYNPVTTRLEPVAINSNALAGDLSRIGLPLSAFPNEPNLRRTVFYNDPLIQRAYIQSLWRISRPGYIEELQQALGPEFDQLHAELLPEFGEEPLTPPWETLRQRQALAREIVNPFQTTNAYIQRPQPTTGTLAMDVGNILAYPVELLGLTIDGRYLPIDRNWVQSDSLHLTVTPTHESPTALILRALPDITDDVPYVHLQVPHTAFPLSDEQPEVTLVTRMWGLTQTLTQVVLSDYPQPLASGPVPDAPLLDEALARYPYLQTRPDQPQWLRIPAGTWEITQPLVLPAGYGLIVDPGTTLLFGKETFLLARGPLEFRGTAEAAVSLRPTAEPWYGVVVMKAGAPSIWQYTTVERTTAMKFKGWSLTGGITFYHSPIRLEHCRILDPRSEDGINVMNARFEFIESEWGGTASDAFDADAGNGIVDGCYFHDIGADAVDVSFTPAVVRNLRAVNIGDKGISIGEESSITAENIYVENADFGAAAKDSSHLILTGATIVAPRIAGLAAYTKKPVFGRTSTISATDITFQSLAPEHYTLIQTGSWIHLNGQPIYGTDIDVDALYIKWVKAR